MPRLIWVFAGRTCHFVGFDMQGQLKRTSRGSVINMLALKPMGCWFNPCSSYHKSNCWSIIELLHDKTNKMPSLIRVFTVNLKKHWVLNYLLSAQWRLIRLGSCPGWSESSLGTHHFVGLSCGGSIVNGMLKLNTLTHSLTLYYTKIVWGKKKKELHAHVKSAISLAPNVGL